MSETKNDHASPQTKIITGARGGSAQPTDNSFSELYEVDPGMSVGWKQQLGQAADRHFGSAHGRGRWRNIPYRDEGGGGRQHPAIGNALERGPVVVCSERQQILKRQLVRNGVLEVVILYSLGLGLGSGFHAIQCQ